MWLTNSLSGLLCTIDGPYGDGDFYACGRQGDLNGRWQPTAIDYLQ